MFGEKMEEGRSWDDTTKSKCEPQNSFEYYDSIVVSSYLQFKVQILYFTPEINVFIVRGAVAPQ